MSERFAVTAETAEERRAACVTMGSRAVGNCVECPAAVSCPILQLKQLSKEMVTASPEDTEPSSNAVVYGDGGSSDGMLQPKNTTVTVPHDMPPQPHVRKQELAAKRRAATEKAMRKRLYQQSNVPQQQSGQAAQQRTFLELLMDGVTELVLANSVRQK